MKFKIKPEVFQKFPNLVVCLPIVLGFDNQKNGDKILGYLRQQEEDLRKRMKLKQLISDPRVTSYFEVFQQFGADPEKIVPTHVALAKRVLEGGQIPDINSLANLYNAVSLKYLTPFGGEDLSTLYGDFVLKFSSGGEQWIGIGAKRNKPTIKGDLVWGDDLDISTKSLNWRQCERTKLTQESKDGYFIMDGFSDINRENIGKAAKEFIDLVVEWCGGKAKIFWMDKNNPEVLVNYKTKDVKSIKAVIAIKKVKSETELTGYAKLIKSAIEKIVGKNIKFKVEHSENMSWGDWSTNVGMVIFSDKVTPSQSKGVTFKSPREVGEMIVAKLKAEESLKKIISEITVAGAGFINITIQPASLISQVNEVLKDGIKSRFSGKKMAVEYTDPNPFKEFHLGHLYSNLIGESIANIFEASGAIVWRGDFYGDAGMHISKSVWGMLQKMNKEKITLVDLSKLSIKERQKFMGQGYALGVNKYEEDAKIKEEIKNINYMIYVAAQEELVKTKNWQPIVNYRQFIEGNLEKYPQIKAIYTAGLRWSLEYFETYYKRLGTKFDGYYPESWVGEYGVKLVEQGLEKGILEKSDGAVVFKGEKYGLHTRVFLNKLGLPTYEAKDLGLAKAKYQDFKYDYSLNVFGKEIDEYYYVVKKAMQLIEPELGQKANHLAHGMVKLPEGKMSSRSGNVITVEWLLNEAKNLIQKNFKCDDALGEQIGQAAVKYALLKSGIGQDVVFDFDKSISFEGNSGPYLQYTYARAKSVLAKAGISSLQGESSQVYCKDSPYWNSEEQILLRTLSRYEETVIQAAEELAPDVVAKFLYDVAQKFNSFYNKHRLIGNDFRLWLAGSTAEILKRGLGLLGIQAPENM